MKYFMHKLCCTIKRDMKSEENYTRSFVIMSGVALFIMIFSIIYDLLVANHLMIKPVFWYGIMDKLYDVLHMSGMSFICFAGVLIAYFIFLVTNTIEYEKELKKSHHG